VSEPTPARGRLLLTALIFVLAVLPPETRGESMAGCAALIVLLVGASLGSRGPGRGRPFLLLSVALCLPVVWAAQAPGSALEPLATFLLAAAAGLAVASLAGRGELGRTAALTLAAAGSWVAIHGIYQKLWGLERLAAEVVATPDLPDRQELLVRLGQGRAFAFFSTPAAMGGFLALAMPVTIGLALASRPGRGRVLIWIAVLLQGIGLLSTESVTAALALLGALVLAVLAGGLVGRRALIAGSAAVLLLLAGASLFRGAEVLTFGEPGSPWRLRAGNFRAAGAMAGDYPWSGVGPGGFAELYPAYRLAGDNETSHVHNLPLELVAEWGWVGGTLLLVLFVHVFVGPLWRVSRSAGLTERGLAVGLAAFAIQNLGDYTAFMPSLLWLAALLAGILSRPGDGSTQLTAGREARPLLDGAVLAATLLAAMLVGLAGISGDLRFASRQAAFAGEEAEAGRLAERAATLAPWNVDAALLASRVAAGNGSPIAATVDRQQRALFHAERAVNLSPVRPAARQQRARQRLVLGDYPGAYADLVEATRLYPIEEQYAVEREVLATRIGRLRPADGGAR